MKISNLALAMVVSTMGAASAVATSAFVVPAFTSTTTTRTTSTTTGSASILVRSKCTTFLSSTGTPDTDTKDTDFDTSKFMDDAKDLITTMERSNAADDAVQVAASGDATATEESKPLTLPPLGPDGLYHIGNKEEHQALLNANPDKILVVKFFAPWCRACKGLEPKFLQISKDPKFTDIPIIFADLTVQHNKAFVKDLGILALPSVQFYAGSDGLVESFPCGPSKVPLLKKKLTSTINDRVDPNTRMLKLNCEEEIECETPPCRERDIEASPAQTNDLTTSSANTVGGVVVNDEQMSYLRNDVPYFKDFTDGEFTSLIEKAKLVTFDANAVIMRQGMKGKRFYVIESGEVEISVKSGMEDPLVTPASYLGTVWNNLGRNNYFGERALITGEPRAASIRAIDKTRCFAFVQEDIPVSSVLAGKRAATESRIEEVNDKYGLDVSDMSTIIGNTSVEKSTLENQTRGSINTPYNIEGVDEGKDVDSASSSSSTVQQDTSENIHFTNEDIVIPLLQKLNMVRQVGRCFDYVMSTRPNWGDAGEIRRRTILVSKLSSAQITQFTDVFKMIDTSGDGVIELSELKRALLTTKETLSDQQLVEMINKADPSVDGNASISFQDFMGVMAEAEFYHLFKDTFQALDTYDSGFVRASDLDRVLCGVRDLISDDRMSIIDVEDTDMMIDYDHFSKILLGTTL